MKRKALTELRQHFERFVNEVEEYYEDILNNWGGEIYVFDQEWIIKTSDATLNYYWALPHKIVKETKNDKYRNIIEKIKSLTDQNGYFWFANVIERIIKAGMKKEEALIPLIKLQDEGVIIHFPRTAVVQKESEVVHFLEEVEAKLKRKEP